MLLRNSIAAAGLLLGACGPQPAPQAAAPPPPDTAAVRTALLALADKYEAAELAGNSAQVAALHTEDARTVFQGLPDAVGRAAIQAQSAQLSAAAKVVAMEILTGQVSVVNPTMATAGGTATQQTDSAGKKTSLWWRWAGGYALGADGQWRLSFLMAFQDSVKVGK